MTTAQKLVIAAIAVVAVIAAIYYQVNESENKKEASNNQVQTSEDVFDKYINEENTTANEQTNQNFEASNTIQDGPKVEVVGTDEEKAIALAKNTWGAQDDSVTFNVARSDGKTFYISVNSKETTEVLAWYKINVENEEVENY